MHALHLYKEANILYKNAPCGNVFGLVYNNNIYIRSYFIWPTATEEYCRECVLDLLPNKK